MQFTFLYHLSFYTCNVKANEKIMAAIASDEQRCNRNAVDNPDFHNLRTCRLANAARLVNNQPPLWFGGKSDDVAFTAALHEMNQRLVHAQADDALTAAMRQDRLALPLQCRPGRTLKLVEVSHLMTTYEALPPTDNSIIEQMQFMVS